MFWLQTLDFESKWIEIENSKVKLISPLKLDVKWFVYKHTCILWEEGGYATPTKYRTTG